MELIENKNTELLELMDTINKEASLEKLAIPPSTKMHYWWTRKPLIVSRAITILSTLPVNTDINKVKRLLNLNNDKRAYKSPVSSSYFTLLNKDPKDIKILDPFAGSGNLLYETTTLGFDVTLMDYNPVAYLIMKATLEYPAKYGEKLVDDIVNYGKKVIEETKKELENFYVRNGRTATHYLWCWVIKCPYCKQRIPLTNHMWLSKKKGIGFRIKPTDDYNFTIEIDKVSNQEGSKFTQKKGKAICIRCKNSISSEEMRKDIAERKEKELIAVVVKGKDFENVTYEDKQSFEKAKEFLKQHWDTLISSDLIPQEDIKQTDNRNYAKYGLRKWYECFTDRQLLVMITLVHKIREVVSQITDKEYAKVIATYLALMLTKHVDYNNIGTNWHVTNEEIAHALTFRSIRIVYNFAEVNPFINTSGSLYNMLDNIVEAVKFAVNNKNIPKILLGSALHFNMKDFDIIITDPPYLDDVPYGEASELFYIWLYRVLKDYYPEIPQTIPIDEDLILSKGRFNGNKKLARKFYVDGMKRAFKNMYNALKDDGLLVVFFAHSSTEAWNMLLDILKDAGFMVVSSYAIHTENEQNVLARNNMSFMSSIVIVCRKRVNESEVYYEDLLPRVEGRVRKMLSDIDVDKLLNLPLTDLLIMFYGAVLEEITKYSRIKSYSADFNTDFGPLIKSTREFMLKEIMTKVTGIPLGMLDPISSFLLLTKIFYDGKLGYDDVLKLTKIYGLNTNDLKTSGFVHFDNNRLRVKFFNEIEMELDPSLISRDNLYQQLIFLEKYAKVNGVNNVKNVLTNIRSKEIAKLVELLIKSYDMKKTRGKSLSNEESSEYNLLIGLSEIFDKGGNMYSLEYYF